MMMLVLQDGDVIQYTINVRKLEEDTEDNNIITLVRKINTSKALTTTFNMTAE